MALWTSVDESAGAPKGSADGFAATGVAATGSDLISNTTISAFTTNQAVGVFGVDTTEQGVSASKKVHPQHAGWVLVKQGTGPVVSITANTGAYSPDGNVYVTFTNGGTSNTTANAQITTNGSKLITSITVLEGGQYITTPTVTAVNANASFTVTMGGRANRSHTETLVAMGSMSGDDEDVIFPDS
jgi:hypothetical protein